MRLARAHASPSRRALFVIIPWKRARRRLRERYIRSLSLSRVRKSKREIRVYLCEPLTRARVYMRLKRHLRHERERKISLHTYNVYVSAARVCACVCIFNAVGFTVRAVIRLMPHITYALAAAAASLPRGKHT